MDFTLKSYTSLITSLQKAGYKNGNIRAQYGDKSHILF